VPQLPQFVALVARLMHSFVPQVTSGGGQEIWHVPFTQSWPVLQA
jgi:hypothetical protein